MNIIPNRLTIVCLGLGLLFLITFPNLGITGQSPSLDENQNRQVESDRITDQEPTDSDKPELPEPKIKVNVNSGFMTDSEFDGNRGRFTFGHAGMAASYGRFTLSYYRHRYEWEDVHRLPFGNAVDDPWQALHTLALSVSHFHRFNDKWSCFFRGGISESFEKEWGRPGLDGTVIATYMLNPKLQLNIGAVVFYHRIRTLALPMLGLGYGSRFGGPPQEGLSMNIGFPETHVTYRLNPKLAIQALASIDSRVYRLADDSIVQKKGYLDSTDYKAGVFFVMDPIKNFRVSTGLGYAFGRNLTIYNKNAHKRGDYDVDGAPFVGLKLELRF